MAISSPVLRAVGQASERARAPKPSALVRLAVGVLWATALLTAGYLWLAPYERALIGHVDGSTELVDSSCPAPLGAALIGSGDRALSPSGEWASGEPPCRRSASVRVGLGALVGATGAGLATVVARRSRKRRAEPSNRGAG